MKKILLVLVLAFSFTLYGCSRYLDEESHISDIELLNNSNLGEYYQYGINETLELLLLHLTKKRCMNLKIKNLFC